MPGWVHDTYRGWSTGASLPSPLGRGGKRRYAVRVMRPARLDDAPTHLMCALPDRLYSPR